MEGSEIDTDATAERDGTQDWLLPAAATPPLVGELEAKVDEAITIARASERAARTSEEVARVSEKVARSSEETVRAISIQVAEIGDHAADAAAQARRAADLAERASEAAVTATNAPAAAAPRQGADALEDAWLRGFTERADRVMARLQAVEQRFTPAQG
jgi:methyl-accepting chemotaxis protein